MGSHLLIVESPAKARTIEKFLGKEFKVKSSFGHIRDLSKKNLGIDMRNGFIPEYEIPTEKEPVVKELQTWAEKAQTVWLASDGDREGEAIAWHLQESLGLDPQKTKRIVFHEITKEAIQHAIENHRFVDMNLVNAQQARRVLDRLVGFEISPILWKKLKPKLSAGRVQSVAVRLIVEREREILSHTSLAQYQEKGKSQATCLFPQAAAARHSPILQAVVMVLMTKFHVLRQTGILKCRINRRYIPIGHTTMIIPLWYESRQATEHHPFG